MIRDQRNESVTRIITHALRRYLAMMGPMDLALEK